MERAAFAGGSIDARGVGGVRRLLNHLAAFFLGIGPEARPAANRDPWWDREAPLPPADRSIPMTLGQQAELFDETGRLAFEPAALAPPARPETPPAAAVPAIPRTVVSVRSKSKATARVVATTRVVPATRVAAVPKAATPVRGAVARQLVLSQSISSGKEEARWFSVPQRALLPRYQLFEGAVAVTEDAGGLRIDAPAARLHKGRVWFV